MCSNPGHHEPPLLKTVFFSLLLVAICAWVRTHG